MEEKSWDEISLQIRRAAKREAKTGVPIYGILNTYDGRMLDIEFGSEYAAEDYIQTNRLNPRYYEPKMVVIK